MCRYGSSGHELLLSVRDQAQCEPQPDRVFHLRHGIVGRGAGGNLGGRSEKLNACGYHEFAGLSHDYQRVPAGLHRQRSAAAQHLSVRLFCPASGQRVRNEIECHRHGLGLFDLPERNAGRHHRIRGIHGRGNLLIGPSPIHRFSGSGGIPFAVPARNLRDTHQPRRLVHYGSPPGTRQRAGVRFGNGHAAGVDRRRSHQLRPGGFADSYSLHLGCGRFAARDLDCARRVAVHL